MIPKPPIVDFLNNIVNKKKITDTKICKINFVAALDSIDFHSVVILIKSRHTRCLLRLSLPCNILTDVVKRGSFSVPIAW